MGQYGAYGYAKNFGWTAERIVGHYYGNTQLGQVADPFVAVRLIGRDDKRLDVYAQAGLNVAGRYFGRTRPRTSSDARRCRRHRHRRVHRPGNLAGLHQPSLGRPVNLGANRRPTSICACATATSRIAAR